jgi:hypothetical protein
MDWIEDAIDEALEFYIHDLSDYEEFGIEFEYKDAINLGTKRIREGIMKRFPNPTWSKSGVITEKEQSWIDGYSQALRDVKEMLR